MASIVIKPKNRTEEEFLTKLLKKLNVEVHLVEEPIPNYETQKAIRDVESKKGTKVKDSSELFSQLGI
jgi:uncharacterized membrane protein YebE (DUF533 family)